MGSQHNSIWLLMIELMHNLFHFQMFSRLERVEMKMFYGLDMQCIMNSHNGWKWFEKVSFLASQYETFMQNFQTPWKSAEEHEILGVLTVEFLQFHFELENTVRGGLG